MTALVAPSLAHITVTVSPALAHSTSVVKLRMVGTAGDGAGLGGWWVAVGNGVAVGEGVGEGVGEAADWVSVGWGLGLGVAVPDGSGEGVNVGEGEMAGVRLADSVAGGSTVPLSERDRQLVVLPMSASARQTRMRRSSRRTDARISIAL